MGDERSESEGVGALLVCVSCECVGSCQHPFFLILHQSHLYLTARMTRLLFPTPDGPVIVVSLAPLER